MTTPRTSSYPDPQEPPLPSEAREVLLRALGGRRVLLLDRSLALRTMVEASARQLEVMPLPHADAHASISPVRDVSADAVVLGEDLASASDPASTLAAVARMAAGAPVMLAFRNRVSAAALLGALLGEGESPGLAPPVVERWLTSAGLEVRTRDGVRADIPRIAQDSAQRLRVTFEALSQEADLAWVLWTVAEADVGARIPGLLSVVVRTHSPTRLSLLDQAIFSLACQRWRPLEIVLAIQPRNEEHIAEAERVLARHAPIGQYTHRVVALWSEGDQRGRLMNSGIRAARGQYLAFLDDDDVVYPRHYVKLIRAIRAGPHGWAVSRAMLARFSRMRGTGELYCTEKALFPAPTQFDLLRLIRSNYIPNHSYVLDRDRLGAAPISFSENVTRAEDYELLLRLAGTFRPAWLAEPGCEYRLRDDGSNVNPLAEDPELVRASEALQWRSADERRDSMKARWPVLFTVSELESETETWDLAPLPSPDRPLRHRLVDAANDAIKRISPGWHSRLKGWVRRSFRG